MQHRKTLMLVLTALFAALTAIGAFFKIPFALAAISLQFLFTAMAGILRGAGDVKMFSIANLVNLAIRVLLSWLCAPLWGVEIVWYAVPVGWLANFVISFAHYRTGKWKEKRIA